MVKKKDAATLVADGKKQLADAKRRGLSLLALIARRKDRITEDFYDIGEALRELMHDKLYGALGHDSFEAMLDARKVMSRAQAYKLVRLVESIPRDEALRLGQEKAYALVTYTAATPEQDVPAALVRKNAKIDGKPLSALSKRDLEEAAKTARAKTETPAAKKRLAADRRLEKKVRALLRQAGISKPEVVVKKRAVVVTIDRAALEEPEA